MLAVFDYTAAVKRKFMFFVLAMLFTAMLAVCIFAIAVNSGRMTFFMLAMDLSAMFAGGIFTVAFVVFSFMLTMDFSAMSARFKNTAAVVPEIIFFALFAAMRTGRIFAGVLAVCLTIFFPAFVAGGKFAFTVVIVTDFFLTTVAGVVVVYSIPMQCTKLAHTCRTPIILAWFRCIKNDFSALGRRFIHIPKIMSQELAFILTLSINRHSFPRLKRPFIPLHTCMRSGNNDC